MGLYNFQKRFVPFIEDGTKTHTIRALRAHPDAHGKTCHLYTGLRTKSARLIARRRCVGVDEIGISKRGQIRVNGQPLDVDEAEAFAKRDGFKSLADMMAFWVGRLPFRGHIVHWSSELRKEQG